MSSGQARIGRYARRAAVALVLALVAVELGVRMREHDSAAPPTTAVRVPAAAGRDAGFDAATQVEDPALLWRNRPNLERRFPRIPQRRDEQASWTLRFDERGFRLHDRASSPSQAPVYRILCVGDSVTLGFNVDQGGDYPAVLEKSLSARHPGRRFDVINAGVSDWSWVQGTEFLVREGFALRPDLVVVAHGLADLAPAGSVTDSERIWLHHQNEHSRAQRPGSAAWHALASWLAPPAPRPREQSPGCRLQEAAGTKCRRVSTTEIGATLRRLAAATRTAGVDLIVANLAESSAAEAVRLASIRDDLRYLDHAADARSWQLQKDMRRARDLRLAFPKVPLVPFGAIGSPAPEGRGPTIRFRVGHVPGGPVRVRGSAPVETGFRFDEEMRDDGTRGDERAGDGVHTAIVETPVGVQSLSYLFVADGRPEFVEPAGIAASNTPRTVSFNRDSDAPVETFGVRWLHSDEVHPDEEGQRRIAASVLAAVEQADSFRRFAAGPTGASSR